MNLREHLDSDYAKLRALKPKALMQYRMTLERWKEHLGREPEPTDLDGLAVQAFLSGRRAQVSTATVVKDRTHICALWGHLARRRVVDQFPVLPPMRAPKRIPRAYRIEEVSKIIRACLDHPGRVCGLPGGFYFASLARSCFETAERVGAHLAARWRDVDLEGRTITFVAEGRKGAIRDIQRPFSAGQAEWLAKIQRRPGDLVWPWDEGRNHACLWYEFKKICAVAGVTGKGFHGFRKSNASYLTLKAGLTEASKQLDHYSTQITLENYVDPSIAKPEHNALDFLPPLDLGDQPPEKPAA
jgi:integrase